MMRDRAATTQVTTTKPAKKVSKRTAKSSAARSGGKVVGKVVLNTNTASLIAVCRTDGCSEKGTSRTFTVPKQGSLVMLPARVTCAVCGREARVDWEDVHVERI